MAAPKKTTARGRRTATSRATTTRSRAKTTAGYPPGYVPHWGDGGINALGSSIVLPIVTKFQEGVMEGINVLLKFCALQAQMSDALFAQNQHLISERVALLNLGGNALTGIELPGSAPNARSRRRAAATTPDAIPAGA